MKKKKKWQILIWTYSPIQCDQFKSSLIEVHQFVHIQTSVHLCICPLVDIWDERRSRFLTSFQAESCACKRLVHHWACFTISIHWTHWNTCVWWGPAAAYWFVKASDLRKQRQWSWEPWDQHTDTRTSHKYSFSPSLLSPFLCSVLNSSHESRNHIL